MITKMDLKTLSLASLLAISGACGKKAVDHSVGSVTSRDALNPDQTVTLEASITTARVKTNAEYTIPKDGDITLPPSIQVVEGNAANKTLKVYLNFEAKNNWELYCLYRGGSASSNPRAGDADFMKGLTYNFVACYDPDQRDLGITATQLSKFTPPVDQDRKIVVEVLGAHASYNTKVQSTFSIKWY